MIETSQINSDISYVRDLVSRASRDPSPASLYLLWAVICLIGFPLADFTPQYVGWYWTFAGPLGAIASWILGWRHAVATGQKRLATGVRHALHWAGMMAAIFLVVPLGYYGILAWSVVYQVIILILACSYFLAGVHLDRPLMWVGLALTVAYVALFFIETYRWTTVGIAISAALAVAGLAKGKQHGRATD